MKLDAVLSLKTDERLLSAVRRAAEHKMSPSELFEQKVSFVYGSMGRDSNVTKETVRQVLIEQAGGPAAAK